MAKRRRKGQGEDIVWDFFSFPVVFGFACGALAAAFLLPLLGYVFFVAVLFLFCFGVAHIVFHGARTRNLRKQMERAEEDERERRILAERAAASQAREATIPAGRRRRRRRA